RACSRAKVIYYGCGFEREYGAEQGSPERKTRKTKVKIFHLAFGEMIFDWGGMEPPGVRRVS
ncbi:MAG: hypothetical protein OXL41_08020, partial [Nitrospinae bacterium]|nr:hypothetical protein [Nitrospinota bacterium]